MPIPTFQSALQLPQPSPDESYEHFVIRAHRELTPLCADPMERNELIWQAWEQARGVTTEEQIAQRTFPADRYTRHRNVCVFAEHSAVDGQGQPREYDLAAMVRVARGSNDRIADFDGFAPLCDGHTPGPGDPQQTQPDILGYAGPFRLGMIGRKKPRWAVFCDEWHQNDQLPRLSGKPRRSVELWTFANDPARMYFDPIAVLGAETPRLSLPVKYRRDLRDGVLVERYCFASPGASNTFLRKPVSNQPAAPTDYEAPGQPFDEKKHPRQGGKFAPKGTTSQPAAPTAPPGTSLGSGKRQLVNGARKIAAGTLVGGLAATNPALAAAAGAGVMAKRATENKLRKVAAASAEDDETVADPAATPAPIKPAPKHPVLKKVAKTAATGAALAGAGLLGYRAAGGPSLAQLRAAAKAARQAGTTVGRGFSFNAATGLMDDASYAKWLLGKSGPIRLPPKPFSQAASGQQPERYHRLAEGVPLKFSMGPNPESEQQPDQFAAGEPAKSPEEPVTNPRTTLTPPIAWSGGDNPVSQAGEVPAPQSEEGTMPLTNDDLAQLLAALAETPQFKFLDQLMQQGEAAGDEPEGDPLAGADEPPADLGAEPPADMPAGPDDDLSDVQDLLVDEGGDEPPAEEPPAEEPPAEEPPAEDDQPTEKNTPAALAALAPMVSTPAAAATTGALGAMALRRHSARADGQQPARYAQLRDAHNRLVQEHGRLASRMQGLLREKSDAERTAVLQAMARRYPDFIDVNTELNAVLYSRKSTMDDHAFQAHCATIEKYAQKAAMVARTRRGDIPQGEVDRQVPDAESERYAARLSQEAVRVYTDALSTGKQMTYDEAKAEAAKRLSK